MKSLDAMAAFWHSMAASAANSASPVSSAAFAFADASALLEKKTKRESENKISESVKRGKKVS
jgi:hypothetical protein